MTTFPRKKVVEEAARLLPVIHGGAVRLAKITNVGSLCWETAQVVVYCLDQDARVREDLERLGWSVRWKSNAETFKDGKG